MSIATSTSIGMSTSIETFTSIGTSTGRLLIAPATVAATGPDTADIVQVVGAIGPAAAAIEAAADTEAAVAIGAGAAAGIADRPD
jgi:hypothetical protein